eukprot:scaffold4589_cov79-Skeletonema_menzelii.AAC.5
MSPPAANTRSRSATPSNTPAKARGSGSPPASVGTKFSALSLISSSPEANDQTTQTAASLLRVNIFGLLGDDPNAQEDDVKRAEFSSMLADYTSKADRVSSSDPVFTIGREHFGMQEYKLVLIGGASVGKSAYVKKLKSNRFVSKYDPTNKVEVTSLVFNSNHGPIKLDIWDVAGCDPFDGYYVGAHGAILMYDVNDKSPTKVLTGNKAESSSKRKKDQKDVVSTFRRKRSLQHFEMSNKTGLNIQKPLLFLLKKLTDKRDLEFIGKEPDGNKSAEKLQPTAIERKSAPNDTSNSSPDADAGVLKSESKSKLEMNKKSAKEAKGKFASEVVSVAAATPLPIDEEGI